MSEKDALDALLEEMAAKDEEVAEWRVQVKRIPTRTGNWLQQNAPKLEEDSDDEGKGGLSVAPDRKATARRGLTIVERQMTKSNLTIKCPVQLNFDDIVFEVSSGRGAKKKTRRILKGICGYVSPGQMMAIMGPSGCGKTTLLNILANRNRHLSGKLLANGTPVNVSFNNVMGYVTQDDVFLENLTVREQLYYSAMLRLPPFMSVSDKLRRVDQIMEELGLLACQNTKIGGQIVRGVSGGERKRCNIGVEMISNPSVLFLDEPTSGLDAYTSLSLCGLLSKITTQGRTIILSIHQPRADIFALFDSLLLLSAGDTVYFGPGSQKCLEYFAANGDRCPTFTNPADYITDILTAENSIRLGGDPEKAANTKVGGLVVKYKQSPLADKAKFPAPPKSPVDGKGQHASWFKQFLLLFKRASLQTYRNPVLTVARGVTNILLALILGSLFWQISDDQSGIQNRLGAIFMVIMSNTLPVALNVVAVFPTEQAVYFREHASGMYHTSAYYLGKVVSELPLQIIFPVIMTTIMYWMVGFQANGGRFFFFLLVVSMLAICSSQFALFVSTFMPSVQLANVLVPILEVIFILFAGFLINTDNIPKYWIWLQYSSFMKYGFETLTANEMHGLTFTCDTATFNKLGGHCPIANGDAVLTIYDIDWDRRWIDVLALAIIIGGFTTFGYLALRIKSYKRENS